MEAPSFAHRRPAASHLPQFTLPSPGSGQDIPSMHIHPPNSDRDREGASLESAPSSGPQRPSQAPLPPASSILTPTSGVTSDGLSPSPGLHTGGAHSSHPAGNQYPYSQSSWQAPGGNNYSHYSSAAPNSSLTSLAQPNFAAGSRSMYQAMNFNSRPSPSSATSDSLQSAGAAPYPPSDVQSFSAGMSGNSNSTGTLSSQQPHPQSSILGSQASATQAHSPAIPSSVGADYRHPPTPGYSGYQPPASTPMQSSYSFAPHPSPTQASPTTTGTGPRGMLAQHSPITNMAPPLPFVSQAPRSNSFSYSVPSMGVPGAVMSNMGNPGGQMQLVGGVPGVSAMGIPHGYHHGHHPHHPLSHMYGHGQQNQPMNERPFKCDQCPQSFNRNHDLKRHKRIHLAVKPFPCNHCDKSFSRKDALKRHRLVKRCGDKDGNNEDNPNGNGTGQETSPVKAESTGEGGLDPDMKMS